MPYLDDVNLRLQASMAPTDLVVGISKRKIAESILASFRAAINSGRLLVDSAFQNISVSAQIDPATLTTVFDAATGQVVVEFSGVLSFFPPGAPANPYRERTLQVADLRFEFSKNLATPSKVSMSPIGGAGGVSVPAAINQPDVNLIAARYGGDVAQYRAEEAAMCLNLRNILPSIVSNLVSFPNVFTKLMQFTLDPNFQIDQRDPEFVLLYGAPISVSDPCSYVPRESTPAAAGPQAAPPAGGAAGGGRSAINEAPLLIIRYAKSTTLDKLASSRLGLTLSDGEEGTQTIDYWKFSVTATLESLAVAFDPAAIKILLSSLWRLAGDGEVGVDVGGCNAVRQKLLGASIDSANSTIAASAEASPFMDNDYLYLKGTYTVEPNITLNWSIGGLGGSLVDTVLNAFLRNVCGVNVNKKTTDSIQVPLLQRRGLLAVPLDKWDESITDQHLLIGVDRNG